MPEGEGRQEEKGARRVQLPDRAHAAALDREELEEIDAGAQEHAQPEARPGDLVDMNEAAGMLKVSRSTFYRWLRSGRIKGQKIGRQWRFYRRDIERFLRGKEPQVDLPPHLIGPIETLRRALAADEVSSGAEVSPAPIVGLVNTLIRAAIDRSASDIHLEPHPQEGAVLRYRTDGVLRTISTLPQQLLPFLVDRLKMMADCNVRETGRPQDGRIAVRTDEQEYDLRVCFLPSALGESVTVRILRPDALMTSLEQIGYAPRDAGRLRRWLRAPWGMIVFTGPTGCGKTTSLYAGLQEIARPEVKIVTIEDPVEYLLPWMVQVQVRAGAGMTFAVAARAALRSDPDVVMIGEIRDFEILQLTHQIALTGHLILTTLHTPTAAGALQRMVDIGSDPFLIAESVRLIVAQRLVRRLCPHCSIDDEPTGEQVRQAEEMARAGGVDWDSLARGFQRAVGCERCHQMRYRGRDVIAETLEVTPAIADALRRGAPVEELERIAVAEGMTTLAADGIRRAAAGETTLMEVLRVMALR